MLPPPAPVIIQEAAALDKHFAENADNRRYFFLDGIGPLKTDSC